jgi:multidrug resistance efflux pump
MRPPQEPRRDSEDQSDLRGGVTVADTATDRDPTMDQAPVEAAPDAPSQRKRVSRKTRIRVLVILVLALLAAAFFIGRYVIDTRNYVSTDNAQIDGNQISVNAPATGILIDWQGQQGTSLSTDAPVGRIEIQGGFVQPQMVIRAPAAGVVAVDNGVEGAFVTAGTQLAIAYDSSGVFVTARINETDINDVHAGQRVKIAVDAFPKAKLTGRVVEVKAGAAGVFSLFPQSNSSGNFQKVTQVIPVKISIDNLQNLPLAPGMNVTVKIRRD